MEEQLEFTICDICEYYDRDEEVCLAFDCNGQDCPVLPCEEGLEYVKQECKNFVDQIINLVEKYY